MISVLYVDDEPGLLEIGKLFLEQSGQFSVDILTSAQAALAQIYSKTYDAIISDYQMPGMDGIDFLKKVRTSGNTIPFILFTGRGREEIVIQALNEGADFYLQKGGEPVSQFAELEHQVIQAVKRKRAENELAKSEEKYRRIVDTAEEGVWQMDKNFDAVYVNRRMAEMLGYTPEEMLGRNLESFVAAEDLADQTARMEERRQGKRGRYERRLMTKDGSIRWMQVSATPLVDPQGRFMGSFAMYSDITERKSAEIEIARRNEDLQTAYEQLTVTEEELRQNYDELAKSQHLLQESEKQYRNVVEDQTEFVSRFKPDGTHIFVNEAYCRHFGMKRDEILGHRFRPKIPVEDQERVHRFFASLTRDHPVGTIKHRVIMQDCTLRWHWWSDRAIFDMSGKVAEYQSVGRDITEEKITEIALEESKRRNAAMIAAMPDLLFVISRDGTCLDFQAPDKTLLALPPSQIIGRNLLDAGFDEDAKKTVLHAISAAIETGTLRQIEYKLSVPAGTSWFEARIVRLAADRVLGIVRDITDRKRTEEALRENEEKYRNIVENAPYGMHFYELKPEKGLVFTGANPGADDILGVRHDQFIGKTIEEAFPGLAGTEVPERYREAAESGSVWHTEQVLYHNGSISGAYAVTAFQTVPGFMTAMFTDITSRKQTEEAHRQSEEKFRGIFDTINDGLHIHEITSDGKPGKFIEVNEAACQMLQYTREELMKHGPLDFVTEYHSRPFDDIIADLSASGHSIFETEHRRKDGTIVPVELNSHVVNLHGKKVGVTVIRDITERKKASDAIHLANRQLNLLTGITRHDILNNVSKVRGYLKIVEMKYGDPAQAEYLRKIESAIIAIKSQIEFTRVYQDLGMHEPQWTDLNTVIPRSQIPAAITLKADVQGVVVLADPMLEKVFSNLLDNSLRHGEQVTEIQVSSRPSEGNLVIVWEDNGVGVAADEKERIFERGFGKNTGLGLFLVREILSLTGITVTENGQPGKGARFELVVPKGVWRRAIAPGDPGK
jgi:PAS domain S-box-containing protein